MKKRTRKMLCALVCSASMVAGTAAVPVFADAMKVVTLGADLSDKQKQTMMKYFNTNADESDVIYITNADERARLSSFVPLEQIGSRTVSCAYVRPTKKGGIKVKTANLTWVTPSMIASSLSTSGVKNCEVIAACPFEVSGTGALTGVLMAYETAVDEPLDEEKKALATEEMVITGNLADEIGADEATQVINQSKIEVIQGDIQSADEITNIVNNVIQQQGGEVTLSQEQLDQLTALLQKIAEQGYDYDEVKDTLERIEGSLSNKGDEGTSDAPETPSEDEGSDEEEDEGGSILDNVDNGALGDDVITGSTEEDDSSNQVVEDDYNDSEDPEGNEEEGNFVIIDDTEGEGDENTSSEVELPSEEEGNEGDQSSEVVIPEEGNEEESSEPADSEEDERDLSMFSEDNSEKYTNAEIFLEDWVSIVSGESEVSDLGWEEDDIEYRHLAEVTTQLDKEAAEDIIKMVEDDYYNILANPEAVQLEETDNVYLTEDLNKLVKVFNEEFVVEKLSEKVSAVITQDDANIIRDTFINYFREVYGEAQQAEAEVPAIPEAE